MVIVFEASVWGLYGDGIEVIRTYYSFAYIYSVLPYKTWNFMSVGLSPKSLTWSAMGVHEMLLSRSNDVDLNFKNQGLPIRSVYEKYLRGVPVVFHISCPIPVQSAKRCINVCSASVKSVTSLIQRPQEIETISGWNERKVSGWVHAFWVLRTKVWHLTNNMAVIIHST
jgi:hypothetical protein